MLARRVRASYFAKPCSAVRWLASRLYVWLAGRLLGWLGGLLAACMPACVHGLAGWKAGRLLAWLAPLSRAAQLAGWLAGSTPAAIQLK